jgi:hypothetical protein
MLTGNNFLANNTITILKMEAYVNLNGNYNYFVVLKSYLFLVCLFNGSYA